MGWRTRCLVEIEAKDLAVSGKDILTTINSKALDNGKPSSNNGHNIMMDLRTHDGIASLLAF